MTTKSKPTTKTGKTTDEPSAASPIGKPLLVTTSHRGVFFGYAEYTGGDTITLKQCRNVVYWGQATKGFLGLAVTGPDKSCRIGPAANSTTLNGVASVSEVSEDAARAFEASPWSNS